MGAQDRGHLETAHREATGKDASPGGHLEIEVTGPKDLTWRKQSPGKMHLTWNHCPPGGHLETCVTGKSALHLEKGSTGRPPGIGGHLETDSNFKAIEKASPDNPNFRVFPGEHNFQVAPGDARNWGHLEISRWTQVTWKVPLPNPMCSR